MKHETLQRFLTLQGFGLKEAVQYAFSF